jgi:putative methyltransferase (TIGR04325 family)
MNKKRLSVLDWGGAAGAYYALAKAVLPGIHLQFTVVDLEPFCRRGREVFPQVRFLEPCDDDGMTYDLVIASSSLQYARYWRQTLDALTGRAAEALFLHRVPVVLQGPSFVVKQRVLTWGTQFVGWHFSRQELIDAAQGHEFALAREFLVAERPVVWKAPVQPEYRGFLFDRLQH